MASKLKSRNSELLFTEVAKLIEESKSFVATTVNSTITILYWEIGKRINQEVLNNKRAEYGKQIVVSLMLQLTEQYGKGWSEKHLRHCLRSAETFTKEQILSAVQRELSWTHVKAIMYLEKDVQRDFYLQMCSLEKWSTRQLQERIDSMLFERTAISKKPDKLIKQELSKLKKENILSPDLVFRDPYVLDFLELKDTFNEKNLEEAILRKLEHFILELGQGFTFVERQKRMIIDGEDFNLDLLFYHRKLKRLIAIDLKLGKFKAAYKGQMELYLQWLQKNETEPHEETPLGLILCTEGNKEQVELLQLGKAGIKIAEYLTELPTKKLLQQKLHQAILISKKRLENL